MVNLTSSSGITPITTSTGMISGLNNDIREKVELLTELTYNIYYNNICNEIMNLPDSLFIKNKLIEELKKLLDTIFKM